MIEWGGHHGGWGGFGPPSYIVKKCPDLAFVKIPIGFLFAYYGKILGLDFNIEVSA
jgi:hypothetical protein